MQTNKKMTSSVSFEGIDTDCMTVGRWILKQQKFYPQASGELTHLLNSIMTACKTISMAVRKAGITQIFGLSGEVNSTGDNQKKLDVLSNELFINMIRSSHTACVMISEENEEPIFSKNCNCKYIVAFDPLDGSSNIECLASIGSIFGIWSKSTGTETKINDNNYYLQIGRKMIASGYVLYGSATMLVLALNDRVCGFTLDPSIGEFIMTHPNMRVPEKGSIYSLNEGNASSFDESLTRYLYDIKFPKNGDAPYKARYVGSMVSDVHRTLLYGGVFIYPGARDAPDGKLRLLYECSPIAFIFECAGGLAVTPKQNVLDIQPTSIHQRSPIYLGSKLEIKRIQSYYN